MLLMLSTPELVDAASIPSGVDPWLVRESNLPIEANKELIRSMYRLIGSFPLTLTAYSVLV